MYGLVVDDTELIHHAGLELALAIKIFRWKPKILETGQKIFSGRGEVWPTSARPAPPSLARNDPTFTRPCPAAQPG